MGGQENQIEKAFLRTMETPEETLFFTSTPKISGHSVSSNYQSTHTAGSSGPIYLWSHTSPQNISVSTKFVAYDNSIANVIEKVNWCLSLTYPMKSGKKSGLSRPPKVLLIVGTWLSFLGIVTQASVEYGEAWNIDNLCPLEATVSLNMERLRTPSAQDFYGFVGLNRENIKTQHRGGIP
jgi:hypothetical protein